MCWQSMIEKLIMIFCIFRQKFTGQKYLMDQVLKFPVGSENSFSQNILSHRVYPYAVDWRVGGEDWIPVFRNLHRIHYF